jgi:galactose mutarotase-like enzyme
MTATAFRAVELSGGGSRVVLVPELGGKLSELHLGGRQWLWTSTTIAHRAASEAVAADDAVSYVLTADTGGFDECFPTVGACTLPAAAGPFAGLALPDHGELWSQTPEVTVQLGGEGGDRATCVWRGRRMPYTLTRDLRVAPDGAVHVRYAAANAGAVPMPFLWSAHPLVPLTPRTRVVLPDRSPVRVDAEHGVKLGGRGSVHEWPHVEVDGVTRDLSRPYEAMGGADYACKLFLGVTGGLIALEEGRHRLLVEYDAAEVPDFGLWINRRGWTPFAGGTPYCNLAFEPCIGAPDSLADALGEWRGAAWLGGGETREWTLVWRDGGPPSA